jgi:hypothetical protein
MSGSKSITGDQSTASGVRDTGWPDRAQPSAFRARCKTTPLDSWRGHFPITHDVLLPILLRAAAGDKDFTRTERILYTACEFWAAIQARSIVTHLGSKSADNLLDAIVAFSAIGATQVARTLNAGYNDMAIAGTAQRRFEGLAALENELSKTLDPVDHLIARYAADMKQRVELPAQH